MPVERMPVLFAAHGSPMNALGGTALAQAFTDWGRALPRPRALLVVSAHREAPRLLVTASVRPDTIHDFGGFPAPLYSIRYPAPGSPDLARRVVALLQEGGFPAGPDGARGLDHGAWSPLLFLFPAADVPVVQLSLLAGASPERFLDVGRALRPLREEDVLLLGSGNIVHNLRTVDMRRPDLPPADWAVAFDAWVKERLEDGDLEALAAAREAAPHGAMAVPTLEHYSPFLVACGATLPRPRVRYPLEGFEHGTISLRSVEMRD
jgi:4,5-DOPA dioxygenase extradiol